MAIGYTPQTWANGSAPPLSAANLQTMDNGINAACDALDTPATMAPIVATAIEAGTATATPNDTDKLGGAKADHSLLYYTWANIKAAIKAYADTLYSDLAHQARHRIGGADALPAASDTVPGLVELATAAEVATGTDTGRSITPATLRGIFASDGGTTPGTVVQATDERLQSQGTFTPILYGTDTAGTPTYVKQLGWWSEKGKEIKIDIVLQISSKGGMAGALVVGAIPFASIATANYMSMSVVQMVTGITLDANYQYMTAQIGPSATALSLYENGTGQTLTSFPVSGASDSAWLCISLSYLKA